MWSLHLGPSQLDQLIERAVLGSCAWCQCGAGSREVDIGQRGLARMVQVLDRLKDRLLSALHVERKVVCAVFTVQCSVCSVQWVVCSL